MSFDPTDDEAPGEEQVPDPGSVPVSLDANALDRNGRRDAAIDRFVDLALAGRLTLVIAHALRTELSQAGPKSVANQAFGLLRPEGRPARRGLTAAQQISRIRVRAILCGNARPGKHDADALHLSEAAEAGCGYFITYDGRILRKRADIETFALPGIRIVTLEEFLALFDRFEQRGPRPDGEP